MKNKQTKKKQKKTHTHKKKKKKKKKGQCARYHSRKITLKSIFKMVTMAATLYFQSKRSLLLLIYKLPRYFLPSFESICLSLRRRHKIIFQDGGHFGFPIRMILTIFDLLAARILPTQIRVNWPFSLGKEAKNGFSRWRPPWISDRNDFSYSWSMSYPDASYQVSS